MYADPDDFLRVFNEDLTFQAGSERECVDVVIVNNERLEEDGESFSLTLTTQDDNVNLDRQTTTVTIGDDDGMLGLNECSVNTEKHTLHMYV